MNEHKIAQIWECFDRLKERLGSQSEACDAVGISKGVISQLRNGKYTKNPINLYNRLAEYFQIKEKAEETYSEVDYVETYISENVYSALNICQIKGGLAIICGDAGIGKTKACDRYIEDHRTNTVMITVNPCITSIKAILKVIADKLGASQARARDELWQNIAQKMNDGMLLIFDEAQHLTLKTIEVLRSFSDYFLSRGQTLGIAFVGNLETVHRLGSKKAEFAQISNRTKLTIVYGVKQIIREDIKKLFPLLATQKMEDEIDLLYRIAQTPQAIRGAINLFSNAYDNGNYTYEALVAMAKSMNMEI